MADLPTPIPSAPLWIGFAALAPLIGAALLAMSSDPETARAALVSFGIYAAAMLSFLGGVRWGLEIARAPNAPNAARLAYATAPSIGGWILAYTVAADPRVAGAAMIFSGLFAVQYVWDRTSAQERLAPAWYPLLREVLTGGAMLACIVVMLAFALKHA
ncbi:MAG TPA: DUF3429 domain-containing protein [Caulobacterales bacterium]|jgi:hypothetical protein|nr:DUF3429 domain-containing protein [Caulobacterales bacterium]